MKANEGGGDRRRITKTITFNYRKSETINKSLFFRSHLPCPHSDVFITLITTLAEKIILSLYKQINKSPLPLLNYGNHYAAYIFLNSNFQEKQTERKS